MKKILLILIVAISLLSLTSCEDYETKADYEKQQNDTGHEGVGDSSVEKPREH